MTLQTIDAVAFLGVFLATALVAWRNWRTGLLVGLGSIWIGLVVWGWILGALDPEHSAVLDGVWLLTGWVVPIALVGAIVAVRRTVDDGRRRRAGTPPASPRAGTR